MITPKEDKGRSWFATYTTTKNRRAACSAGRWDPGILCKKCNGKKENKSTTMGAKLLEGTEKGVVTSRGVKPRLALRKKLHPGRKKGGLENIQGWEKNNG